MGWGSGVVSRTTKYRRRHGHRLQHGARPGTAHFPVVDVSMDAKRNRCPGMFDRFHDPEFRTLVRAARAVITERVHRGVAMPPDRLAVAALDEMPDEDDPAAVRAWAPSAAFRDAVRSVVLATLEQYVGIVEALADEADREDGDDGETMH